MAEKSFGIKQINMIGVGTPAIESSDDLIINTNGSERVRILSGGNIGIGTTAGGASSNTRLTLQTTDSSACRLVLANSGSSASESTQIWSQNNELVFNAGGSEQARITADGLKLASDNGINFSAYATSGNPSSNLLDDYEEGTWTPTAVNYSGTLTVNSATYLKVGHLCFVHGYVSFSNTTDSSNLILDGLPFTGFDSNNRYYVISAHTNGGLEELNLRAQGTSTQLTAVHLSSGDGDSKPTFTSLANKFIIFSGCFKTT